MARSARMNSRSSRSRSRAASTLPSGCGCDGSSNARTTWSSASESRSRARCSAGSSSVPTWPSDDAGGAGRSTYVTSAWTTFFGLKISARRSRRASGTFTTPTFRVSAPNPPVCAWPRVRVLKTVVLPLPARPTIAICTAPFWRSTSNDGGPGRPTRGLSVPRAGIHHVPECLAAAEADEVVAEQVDAAVEDPGRRPGRMRRQDHVRHVPVGRGLRQRLVAKRVERGAPDPVVAEGADERRVVDEPPAGDIDEPRLALHRSQGALVDHPLGLGGQRRGEDDEVRF